MASKFIVFEGGEGAGKSYQIEQLVRHLIELGIPVLKTREPGGSDLAELLRRILFKEAEHAVAEVKFFLFWAARWDHLQSTVIPALDSGTHVLCDRFDSSTWAHQICGENQPQLRSLFSFTRQYFLSEIYPPYSGTPHYILLDIDPKIGIERVVKRGEEMTHFDKRDLDYHARVYDGYREFMRRFAKTNSTIIDANQPIEVVSGAVFDTVRKLISLP